MEKESEINAKRGNIKGYGLFNEKHLRILPAKDEEKKKWKTTLKLKLHFSCGIIFEEAYYFPLFFPLHNFPIFFSKKTAAWKRKNLFRNLHA